MTDFVQHKENVFLFIHHISTRYPTVIELIIMLAVLSLTVFAVAALANPVPDVPTLSVELGTPGLDSGSDVMPPDLTTVYINNITYGGSGCPQGTVAQYISADVSKYPVLLYP